MEGEEPKPTPKAKKPKDPTDSLVYQQVREYNKTRQEFLRLKRLKGTLSSREQAESKARHRADDDIISFLESEKAAGRTLSPGEEAELKARKAKFV